MITQILLQVFISVLTVIFYVLPTVTTLPTIGGFDIDSALVSGMGGFDTFINIVWPIAIVWDGFIILMGYYSIKMLFKFVLGHRAPGQH